MKNAGIEYRVVQVVGEKDGRVESAHESDGGYVGIEFFEQTTPESIGTTCAERVRILLEAKPAPAGTRFQAPRKRSAQRSGSC